MDNAAAVGDGIYQLQVPITGNPLGHTLVYAMESPGGLVLIDAGWDDDNAWDGLTSGLEAIGHSVTEVEGIVLTHFHPDHTGLCGRVRETSGAWIAMHEADHSHFEEMSSVHDAEWMNFQRTNLALAGATPDDLDAFEKALPDAGPTGPHSAPDRMLVDDEIIPLAGRGLRVIYTPGHTPGHVCFYLEDANVMFTGDHVLQKTT